MQTYCKWIMNLAHAVIQANHFDVAVIVFLCLFKWRALFLKIGGLRLSGLFFEPCVTFLRILATLLDGWDPHGYNKAQRMNRMEWKSDAEKRDCTLIKEYVFLKDFRIYLFLFIYIFGKIKSGNLSDEKRGAGNIAFGQVCLCTFAWPGMLTKSGGEIYLRRQTGNLSLRL